VNLVRAVVERQEEGLHPHQPDHALRERRPAEGARVHADLQDPVEELLEHLLQRQRELPGDAAGRGAQQLEVPLQVRDRVEAAVADLDAPGVRDRVAGNLHAQLVDDDEPAQVEAVGHDLVIVDQLVIADRAQQLPLDAARGVALAAQQLNRQEVVIEAAALDDDRWPRVRRAVVQRVPKPLALAHDRQRGVLGLQAGELPQTLPVRRGDAPLHGDQSSVSSPRF
jgi:hypothetical protein